MERFGGVRRLGRLPLPLELLERAGEAGGKGVRNVVVAGHREDGAIECSQEPGCARELSLAPAVAEVAARNHELGFEALDQDRCTALDRGVVTGAEMEVGEVQNARRQAGAGYRLNCVTEDSAEIFDDLYLGLRAGGAIRKQRRGEPLTTEEREALGRWQRLSPWRKALAVGGFAIGTFGLGFTLGGLIFGRWRKA
jgi:hypothetical protein